MAVQVTAMATQAISQPATTPLGTVPLGLTVSSTDQQIVVNIPPQPVFEAVPSGPVKSLELVVSDSCKFDARNDLPYQSSLNVFYQEDGKRTFHYPDYAITLSVNSDQGMMGTPRRIGPAQRTSSTVIADIPVNHFGCDADGHLCGQFFYQTTVPGTYTFTATGAGASASLDMTCK